MIPPTLTIPTDCVIVSPAAPKDCKVATPPVPSPVVHAKLMALAARDPAVMPPAPKPAAATATGVSATAVHPPANPNSTTAMMCPLGQGAAHTPSTGLPHPSFNHCRI